MTDPERIALFCIDDEISYLNTQIKHYNTEYEQYKQNNNKESMDVMRYSIVRVQYAIQVLERVRKSLVTRFELFKKNPDNTHIIPPDYNPSNFKGSNT